MGAGHLAYPALLPAPCAFEPLLFQESSSSKQDLTIKFQGSREYTTYLTVSVAQSSLPISLQCATIPECTYYIKPSHELNQVPKVALQSSKMSHPVGEMKLLTGQTVTKRCSFWLHTAHRVPRGA